MNNKNIVQQGERYYARSKETFCARYSKYMEKQKGKMADKLCMTVFSNRKEHVESLLMRDFSTNEVICNYQALGIDLVFIPGMAGINLVEFDASYKAFFKTRKNEKFSLNEFVETFPYFSLKNTGVLFIADAFIGKDMIRHVFTKGTIEITTPSILFEPTDEKSENQHFSSAYRAYLKREAMLNKGPMENILEHFLKEMDPDFEEFSSEA